MLDTLLKHTAGILLSSSSLDRPVEASRFDSSTWNYCNLTSVVCDKPCRSTATPSRYRRQPSSVRTGNPCEVTGTRWCRCCFDKRYSNFVIEDEGGILLVCTDNLCAIIEPKSSCSTTPKAARCRFPPMLSIFHRLHGYLPNDRISWRRSGNILCEGFLVEEDGVFAIACDEGMCDAIRRPGRFDE
jgi:hypothetical protein